MPLYYFFQRNNNFSNGNPTLRSVECNSERWADIRTKIEEMLGVDRSVRATGKRTEPSSLFGCVVATTKTIDWTTVRKLSDQLPPLENGSMLLDGDLICIAVAPYRSILYLQDLYHRFWLYCLIKQYYASKGFEKEVLSDMRRYDLRRLITRVIALSDQKANPTINVKQKNLILQNSYQRATERYEKDRATKSLLFDFECACKSCFGTKIHEYICSELSQVCIDMDRRTKFLSKLIRDAGGDIEYGDSIAKRLGITDPKLVLLVRDVLHNYEPQYVAKENSIEFVVPQVQETDEEEERETKRRRIDDQPSLEVLLMEQEEQEKKQRTSAAEESVLIQNVVNDSANFSDTKKQPIFNMQVYCLCCDVPGHHTNICPRLEFLEHLRTFCNSAGPIPWNIFYAPENGIVPISRSSLGRFVASYFPSRAGEINRKLKKQTEKDEFSLPPVPYYNNVRWVADLPQ